MTRIGDLLGRGMSFPPRVDANGRIQSSEGEENVRESIRVILLTELEERVRLPQFGGSLGRFLFQPNSPPVRHQIQERIQSALATWEPRIRVEAVSVEPDPQDSHAAIASITYRLVATQARERVAMSVPLQG